ncbi:MAG: hypothetical protein QW035_01155 [Candidatus Anstonellales archaeon]
MKLEGKKADKENEVPKELRPYDEIVRKTADFKFGGNISEDVRKFMEYGGLPRVEKKPVSKKVYGSVLYVKEPMEIIVGKENVATEGSQVTKYKKARLEPGLYLFEYNTESTLTIRRFEDPERILTVCASLKPKELKASDVSFSLTAGKNEKIFERIIKDTIGFYKANPEAARLLEFTVDLLYGSSEKRSGIEAIQNESGLRYLKLAGRELMKLMEEALLTQHTNRLVEMTIPAGATGRFFTSMFSPNALPLRQVAARSELQLSNNTVDNMYVYFTATEKGEPVLRIVYGTQFFPSAKEDAESQANITFNPIIMYNIILDNKAEEVRFFGDYKRGSRGPFDGVDYTTMTPGLVKERELEGKLTKEYRKETDASLLGPEVKVYTINAVVHPSLFVDLLCGAKEESKEKSKHYIPKK